MPDNIIFNTIPTDIRTPGQYVEIDNSKALRGLPSLNRRILVVGNKLPTGTAAPLTLYRVNSGDEGATLSGRGSVLHEMLPARTANKTSDIWALSVEDLAAGVAATKTITVTGPAAAAGTIALYINGQKLSIGVAAGDTASVVATAIVAVVDGYLNGPVKATAVAGVVTLTARHRCLHPGYRRVGQLLRRRVPAGWPDSGDRQRRGRHRQSGRGRRGGSDLRRMVLHHHFALERFREHGDH
ncbi:hypothetical protein WJ970_24460 [Achromobacter xylosoxidans]